MISHPIFDSVRQLLSQGDTGQALQILLSFLEKDGSRPDVLRILRVVEANYNATRQQEIKGILEFSDARRDSNTLLPTQNGRREQQWKPSKM